MAYKFNVHEDRFNRNLKLRLKTSFGLTVWNLLSFKCFSHKLVFSCEIRKVG
jgi:hypothetical protein